MGIRQCRISGASNFTTEKDTMKKFVSRYLSMINKRDLVTSVTASVIILAIVSCGGAMGVIPLTAPGTAFTRHIATSQRAGSHIFPGSSNTAFLAAMFATAPAPSQLQQSYDSVCNFQQGFLSAVPSGSLVPLSMAGESSSCTFFSGAQPGSGKRTIFDGQLGTLVATGTTVSGVSFQCRDVTTTVAISDNSFTRAYLDPNSNTVVVFNSLNGQLNQVPFACNGIGSPTDQVATIEVEFAKI